LPNQSITPSQSWPRGDGRFATTHWTVLLKAGSEAGEERSAAWEHLCRTYWYPAYAFVRRRGAAPEDARDLVQGFFAGLIEQDWLAQVERREVRFSTLLVSILKNFLIKQYHHDHAQKRGGGRQLVSLDLMTEAEEWFGREPADTATPEAAFERRCAEAVLTASLTRLRAEYEATGKARVFQRLSPFLSREPAPGEYAAAATALGVRDRSIAVAVHRLRADYREIVREEIAAGVRDEALVEEELRALAAVFGAG
jgi:DNA-directed RNA polymerase specialized sigma24 family protein